MNISNHIIERHFSLSLSIETDTWINPLRINTGDKSVGCRSCSVVAHHEGLSSLRPGFKSRHEHLNVKVADLTDANLTGVVNWNAVTTFAAISQIQSVEME